MKKSKYKEYPESLGSLFEDVQINEVYPDSMTFPDLIPIDEVDEILDSYKKQHGRSSFNLRKFVHKYFKKDSKYKKYKTKTKQKIEKHIEELWDVSARNSSTNKASLIALPHPYVVAGGRFNAQWYWDSYFIMLGLATSSRYDMIDNMLKNFAFLIDKFGFIPSGNRTYYTSRSQAPFFSHMILLSNKKSAMEEYLPYLLAEYSFWMQGSDKLSKAKNINLRVVLMPDGEIMNRYFDNQKTPRPESYKEDIKTAEKVKDKEKLYLNIRATAESGWDFSSRWMEDGRYLDSLITTELIPIDLNSLLVHLELVIAKTYRHLKKTEEAKCFEDLAKRRMLAIRKYCYSEEKGFFFDFNFEDNKQTDRFTLASVYPLFTKIATKKQAKSVANILRKKFLKKGGLITTLHNTDQQWDYPNGWAALQWIAIKGLRNYHYYKLANKIKKRWIKTNIKLYKKKGKLVEKYNVIDTDKTASGGEYPLQDGFGMTNGVLLSLLNED